jgi:pimeloyl-ACP methyl ester carboxylesterase
MTGRPSQGRDVAVRPSTTPGAGVRLAVDLWGDASDPPAVFLHGAGQSRRAWDEAAATVAAAGWHAVTVDHRGHGDSEWPVEADYDFEHFAGDLDAVVGSFEQRPVVVGASLGDLLPWSHRDAAPNSCTGVSYSSTSRLAWSWPA